MAENKTLSSLEVNVPIHLKHITYKLGGTEFSKYNQVGKKRQNNSFHLTHPKNKLGFSANALVSDKYLFLSPTRE